MDVEYLLEVFQGRLIGVIIAETQIVQLETDCLITAICKSSSS